MKQLNVKKLKSYAKDFTGMFWILFIKIKVKLIAPIAMEDNLRFAIREGGRTVGAGVVSKIIE